MLFTGTSHPELAKEIAKLMGLSLGKISVKRFPDNEIAVQVLENVKNQDVFVLQTFAIEPNNFILELFIIVDALKRASAKSITVLIPYFGYARQDRMDKPGVPITAKLLADLLTRSGVTHVVTQDLHSPQIEGFFDITIENLHSREVLFPIIKNLNLVQPVIIAPDLGSIKIADAYSNFLSTDIAIVEKQRISATESSLHLFIGDVKDRDVLIVDDMCSTAGTLVLAAETCKKMGAKNIYACVGHGLFVGDAVEKITKSPIQRIITTNSIPASEKAKGCKKIEYVSVAPLFAGSMS